MALKIFQDSIFCSQNKGHKDYPNQKQSLVIRKLNDTTISGGPTLRCGVYPPRDATGADAARRDGGQTRRQH